MSTTRRKKNVVNQSNNRVYSMIAPELAKVRAPDEWRPRQCERHSVHEEEEDRQHRPARQQQ